MKNHLRPIENVPELLPDTYLINEYGLIYSKIKNRYLKGTINNYGYQLYRLKLITGKFKWFMCHRLVGYTYLSLPTNNKLEINHKDGNKLNNHYTNLEWVTHSQNILKTFRDQGREPYWKNKNRPSPSIETRLLMSNGKKKTIKLYESGKYVNTFDSVQSLCDHMGWYRKKYNRIKSGENKKMSSIYSFIEVSE